MRDSFTHDDGWYCALTAEGFGRRNNSEPCRWSVWTFITEHYTCSTRVFEKWPNSWLIAHYFLFIPLTLERTKMPDYDPPSPSFFFPGHVSVLYKCWTFYVCRFPRVCAVTTHSSLSHRTPVCEAQIPQLCIWYQKDLLESLCASSRKDRRVSVDS